MPSKIRFKSSNDIFKLFSSERITHSPLDQVSTPSEPSLFAILPAELCIFIFTLAAKFSQINEVTNPYSTAVALCRVSRTVRYIVLPELLHTIVLPKSENVFAFMYALKMQKKYGWEGNRLHFDYASHVYKIWIGKITYNERKRIDVSLLAPVLCAAKSLALDIGNVLLLDKCLTQARKSTRFKFIKRRKSSQFSLSWSTIILTLAYQPMTAYTDSTLRVAFFLSIKQFIFRPPTSFRLKKVDGSSPGISPDEPFHYYYYSMSSFRVDNFPWASPKSPQTTVVALLAITLHSSDFKPHTLGNTKQLGIRKVHVRLLEGALAPSLRDRDGQISTDKDCYLTPYVSLSFDGTVTANFDWGQTCILSP